MVADRWSTRRHVSVALMLSIISPLSRDSRAQARDRAARIATAPVSYQQHKDRQTDRQTHTPVLISAKETISSIRSDICVKGERVIICDTRKVAVVNRY